LVILILSVIALVVVWSIEGSRQDHNLQTMIAGVVTVALLFFWAILFSRFAGRIRLAILCVGVVAGFGADSYRLGLEALARYLESPPRSR